MTNNETELIAALEADIRAWEDAVDVFTHFVGHVEIMGVPGKISGSDYARSIRQRISDYHSLIERVRKG